MRVRVGKAFFAFIFIVLGMVVITAVIFFTDYFGGSPVLANVFVEAGTLVPEPDEFLAEDFKSKGYKGAAFAADLDGFVNSSVPGTYNVDILIGNKIYKTSLTIQDTTPPAAAFVNRSVLMGQNLEASDFVRDIQDSTPVEAAFETEPDFNRPGVQIVGVILTDMGGNATRLYGELNVLEGSSTLTVEAGTPVEDIKLENFVNNLGGNVAASFQTELSYLDLNLNVPGEYAVPVLVDGALAEFCIKVVDTVPPSGTPVSVTAWKGRRVPADSFVTDVYDITFVTASFKNEPDWDAAGETAAEIVLTDTSGNKTEISAELKIISDLVPPVFSGLEDKYIMPGGTVAYRLGVEAADEADGPVDFAVDSSNVDIFTEGVYTVTYSAADFSGNTAEASIKVTVSSADPEAVYEMADEILAEIIKEDMSDYAKGKAIYTWARNNIRYVSHGDKDDIIKGTYNALKLRSGDCYTFYAFCEFMLTRVGIKNFGLERVGGSARHYWSVVYMNDGWYHFDSCPYKEWFDGYLFTETKAQNYTKARGRNYYVYDETAIPKGVEIVWE